MKFKVPEYDEWPSQEMIDFLNENPNSWEGTPDGIVLFSDDGEYSSIAWPGDFICRDEDMNYYIEQNS